MPDRHCHGFITAKGQPTEAEDRRELSQHGVLPCLAGGKGLWCDELYCDGGHNACHDVLYRLPCQGAAQLRASGILSCYCCWYVTKCTQNTDMTEITQGIKGRGQHSKFSVAALWKSLNRGRAVFLASSQLQLSFGRMARPAWYTFRAKRWGKV